MKYFFLIFGLVLSGACNREEKIPDNVLSPEKMTAIVFDLARADDYVSKYLASRSQDEKHEKSIQLYEGVFALHGADKAAFDRSMTYYKEHPAKWQPIFDSLRSMENQPVTDTIGIDTNSHLPADTIPLRGRRSLGGVN